MSEYAELTRELLMKADMIQLGEKIAFGSDSEAMRMAAAAIDALERRKNEWIMAAVMQNLQLACVRDKLEVAEARVKQLEDVAKALRDDMLERAEAKIDRIGGEQYRVVNAGNTAWTNFCAALNEEPTNG